MIICDKKYCSGCAECAYICPRDAIRMIPDEEGFIYPEIDEQKCVECGACEKKCPANKRVDNTCIAAYAAYSKDKIIRRTSSSGGIFSHLAMEMIRKGGAVIGAGFGKDLCVVHKTCETIEEIKYLRGSKYVQSSMGESYREIKRLLSEGRKVLFSGTPCQCSGVRNAFGNNENLLIVDFICHGVPSPAVWKKYVTESFEKASSAAFRDKSCGWEEFSMRIENEKGTYRSSLFEDPYLRLFLQNTILRKSCYECSWKGNNYASDITLADFWGISKVFPHMNDDKGVSVVVIRSKEGEKAFDEICNCLTFEKTNVDTIARINISYKESARCPKEREAFFEDIKDNKSIKYLCEKYVRPVPKDEIIKTRIKRTVKILIGKVYKLKRAVKR